MITYRSTRINNTGIPERARCGWKSVSYWMFQASNMFGRSNIPLFVSERRAVSIRELWRLNFRGRSSDACVSGGGVCR